MLAVKLRAWRKATEWNCQPPQATTGVIKTHCRTWFQRASGPNKANAMTGRVRVATVQKRFHCVRSSS